MSLFSQKAVDEAQKESEKFANKKKDLDPGVYQFKIINYELTESKAKDPMLVFTLQPRNDRAELIEYISFTKTNSKWSVRTVVDFFYRGFGFTIKPATEEDPHDALANVFAQTKKFKGKTLKGAVKHEEELFEVTADNGSKKMIQIFKPKLWYVGAIDKELTFSVKGSVVRLDNAEKAKIVDENTEEKPSENTEVYEEELPW